MYLDGGRLIPDKGNFSFLHSLQTDSDVAIFLGVKGQRREVACSFPSTA
jgi:hypothetical protein